LQGPVKKTSVEIAGKSARESTNLSEADETWLVLPPDHGRCDPQSGRIELEATLDSQASATVGLACFLSILHRHTNQSSLTIGVWRKADGMKPVSCEIHEQTSLTDVVAACSSSKETDAGKSNEGVVPTVFVFGTGEEVSAATSFTAVAGVSLLWVESGLSLSVKLQFDGKLFLVERMKEFLAQFEMLVRQAIASPHLRVLDYSLMTPLASTWLPDPTAAIDVPRYPLLTESFASIAATRPDEVAIRQSGKTWSYADLDRSSGQLAAHLCGAGVALGNVVAVSGPRSFGVVSSVLGVFRSGATLLTIDPKLPFERQAVMMKQTGAKFLVRIGEPGGIDDSVQVITVDPETGLVSSKACAASPATQLPVLIPNAAAYIFFTSGSTGVPKGVVGSHQGLAHFLDWQRKTFDIGPGDRAAQITTLSFDMVLRDMFLVLTSGGTLCIPAEAEVLDPSAILMWMASEQISILHVVPSLLRAWTNHVPAQLRLPSLRRVFLAGEPLTDALILNFRAVLGDGPLITNFYGPTETTLIKCFHKVFQPEPGVQPIGRPQPETQILILNRNRRLCGVHEIGEIAIRTPFRTLGYLNAPEATAKAFIPNPFRKDCDDAADLIYLTGDSGCYRADGLLVMRGRMDNQVKIRGVRVEPGEVEAAIGLCAGVKEAAVVAHENAKGIKYLAAYVAFDQESTRAGNAAATNMLRDYLRARLPENMVPSVFVILDALPLLPNGKVNKKALKPTDVSSSVEPVAASGACDGPRNPLEAELLAIWKGVLGHERVGVNDSFVELGGDSLTAISALVRMQRLGIPDAFARGIFQGWSIRQISDMADGNAPSLEGVRMPPKVKTNLLVNVLRGILVIILVAGHWIDGLLNRLPDSLHGTVEVLMPLFNVATPGFAMLFGLSLGYIYLPMYLTDPAQSKRGLRQGVGLVAIGVMIRAALDISMLMMSGDPFDSTTFFASFYSALLYYLLALATAPLWFKVIALNRKHIYRTMSVMLVATYVLYQTAQWLFLSHEQVGFVQLCRLMLVAKFNYFNMSVGAFSGLAAGYYLYQWSLGKQPLADLTRRLLLSGCAVTIVGLISVYMDTGSFWALHDAARMPLWKWIFYGGTLLLAASLISVALSNYERYVAPVRVSINLLSVLGQISLVVFVFHNMVLRAKALLVHFGVPGSPALLIPLGLFFGGCGWLMFKLYELYYGAIGPQQDAAARVGVAA